MTIGKGMLAILVATVLTGCAVMDPYIRSDRMARIEPNDTLGCLGRDSAQVDEALKTACKAVVLLEKSRSEIVRTRSGLTAALFPVAGIVGYNAARGINAPTNAALVAGGMAGYSATATLAQRDRVRVYENGIQAISCGIGLYETSLAEAVDGAGAKYLLATKIMAARLAIESSSSSLATSPAIKVAMGRFLDSADHAVRNSASHSLAKRQLVEHVRHTLAQVNTQLTLTVPTDSEALESAIGNLNGSGKTPAQDMSPAINAFAGLRQSQAAVLGDKSKDGVLQSANLLTLLEDILRGLEQVQADSKPISLSFSKCSYAAVSDVGVATPSSRLMLGPGDASNGSTIELAASQNSRIRVYGGVPPFELVHTGDLSGMTAQVQATNGVSYVDLTGPSTVSSEQTIDFTLSDAVGMQAKKFRVRLVP